METLTVGCAMIEKEGKFLIAQRSPGMPYAGYWEFPGGKRENGESLEGCLVREVAEELGICIRVQKFFAQKDFEYPHRKVSLFFYFCGVVSGRPSKRECFDFAWVMPGEMKNFRFLPADWEIIDYLIRVKRSV